MKRRTTEYVAMNTHRCTACWKCVEKCPKRVIGKVGFLWHRHVIFKNADACIGCGKCIKTCPNRVFFKPDEVASIHKVNTGVSFRIERLLPMTFIVSAVTGIGLHVAGHGISHETWHNWAVAHVLSSFLWFLSVAVHVKHRRHWYKTLVSKGFTGNHWITFFLTILFLTVTVTGIFLIAYVEGANSSIGLWHYKLGIFLLVLSLIHALWRK